MKKCASFQTWKMLVNNSLAAFPKIWWRMAVINIMTIAIIIGIMVLSVFGVVSLWFGGFQEFGIFLANQQFGGEVGMGKLWALVITFAVFFLAAILFGTIGKIAIWTIVQNFKDKKDKNPFKTYFVDTWQYLGRYLWLALKIFFYIMWPIFLGFIMFSLFNLFFINQIDHIGILILLVLSGFTIYRVFRIILAPVFLIAANKSAAESMKTSIKMVKGNWWKVAISLFAFGFIVSIPLFFSNLGDYYMSFGWDFSAVNLKDYFSNNPQLYSPSFFVAIGTLFSLFVVLPLVSGFMYFFMIDLAKSKKIKI